MRVTSRPEYVQDDAEEDASEDRDAGGDKHFVEVAEVGF